MLREIVGFRRRMVASLNPLTSVVNRYPIVFTVVLGIGALAFVGVAVDHSNAVHAKADLQQALDSAAQEAVRDIDVKSDEEVKKSVQVMVEDRLVADQDLASLVVAVDRQSKRLRCRASLRVDATLTSLIGPPYQEVVAATDAVAETTIARQ